MLKGKEIILRVVEQAKKCRLLNRVIVATDDKRIHDVVVKAGHTAVMTSPEHGTGTERIAETVKEPGAGIVVNIQGDEPMIDPESVDEAVQALLDDPELNVSTLAVPITDPDELEDPNAVKVVTDRYGMALYFSRSQIPFIRGNLQDVKLLKHLGLYVYRREFLLQYAAMEPTVLEKTEQLEQLRILENGQRIKVVIAKRDSIGIDTPKDLKRAEELLDA